METDHESAVADYNLPSGYALNGTNQYMRTANNALLNPGSGPFSIVALGVYPNSSGIIVSKRAAGVGDGYVISSFGGNTAIFLVDGASATATLSGADATTFDGNPHVLVGTHSGTAQVLYRDATVIDSDTVTTGAVTNTGTFTAGAYDGGSNFYAMNPLHAWAYYPRVLTATEVLNVTRYLLGVPGYRPPAGANAFYDFRDSRSDARLNEVPDLSGNGLTASMIGSTFFRRGYPWALDELEQFSP
jgi:hypothetical protein